MKPDFLSDESYIENEDLGQLANIFTNLKKNTLPLAALGIPEKVVNSNVKWRSPSSEDVYKRQLQDHICSTI